MEKTLQVLNELEEKGIIAKYALGGAIAATFYIEPVLTYDLDVFISLPIADGPILLLSPIYEYLRAKGYETDREHVLIEGVPVQFLPVHNALTEEALDKAQETSFKEIWTRVFRAEHLVAIMLQTYRPKDKTRITEMLDKAVIDRDNLMEIIERHGLGKRWREFS